MGVEPIDLVQTYVSNCQAAETMRYRSEASEQPVTSIWACTANQQRVLMKTKRRTCENKQTSKRALMNCVLRDRSHVEPMKTSNLGVAPSQKISYLQTFALNRSSALRPLLPPSPLVSPHQARPPAPGGGGHNHQRSHPANLHRHKDHRLERSWHHFLDFS